MNRLLLTTAAAAGLAVSASAQVNPLYPTWRELLAGFGYEEFAFVGFTYDSDFNEFGSGAGPAIPANWSDTVLPWGDRYASTINGGFTPRGYQYLNGQFGSSDWNGENNLSDPGDAGASLNDSTIGEGINTVLRTNPGNPLYLKPFDDNSEFSGGGFFQDRALSFNLSQQNLSTSFIINPDGRTLSYIEFAARSYSVNLGNPENPFVPAQSTITFAIGIDGNPPVPVPGLTTVVSGTDMVKFTRDVAAQVATVPGIVGATSVQVVMTLDPENVSGETYLVFDNVQFIGVPEPSAVALLLGLSGLAIGAVRRRRA